MGRLNTPEEHAATLEWAGSYRGSKRTLDGTLTLAALRSLFKPELDRYFALCCLARSTTLPRERCATAHGYLFRVRVALELDIQRAVMAAVRTSPDAWGGLFDGWFYGSSNKQGTSLRMPLLTCEPTKLCGGACYAHDVLDAAPATVVRGAVNGAVAELYERGSSAGRNGVIGRLEPHTRRAVSAARKELKWLPPGFRRRPHIRFSHVGEIVFYPEFANALARQVRDLSAGGVDCVVYTRHARARELDPDLFVVNFTLDPSSGARKATVPSGARVVYAAFDGMTSADADVNFLEHHRWVHFKPKGTGRICPATAPETKIRTCDACWCNRCFVKPERATRPQKQNRAEPSGVAAKGAPR